MFLKPHFQVSMKCLSDPSWEEKAFAEDAARCLRGCIWPPRSYSCSFCSRVFRSAQALGGHMNVHRRDRAKLKQSTSYHYSIVEENQKGQSFGSDSAAKRCFNDVVSCSDDVETGLSVGLSTSVLFENRQINKRPKVVAVSALQCSPLRWEGIELKPAGSIEGLDLELRLGVL
ncbi:hypothetical protein HRI_002385900 [Hibiscus trionum]|uniref:C2H2-type domain-containing protein n=1 Tax=Hibiscus trionum TaxID=183268 RepID=A0A9W7I1D5_HIBTR|nr:hypothetical protein HRI_002385900 [Hibiscus trionum]